MLFVLYVVNLPKIYDEVVQIISVYVLKSSIIEDVLLKKKVVEKERYTSKKQP